LGFNIKVYIIDKPFCGQDILIMGRALKEHLKHNFPNATLIKEIGEAKAQGEGFLALLYTNSPLCNAKYLDEKCSEMLAGPFAYCKIGDGFLQNLNATGKKTYICNHARACRVQTFHDISVIYNYLKREELYKLANQNICILHPQSTHIDITVSIGEGSIIHPMVRLERGTTIGNNVEVFPYCHISDTQIGDNSKLYSTFANSAVVGANCMVGPFACLRPGTIIGDNCRIGPYVEIKKSVLGKGVKAAHLAYVGDSFVDSGTNIGCGAVFANYDGKRKHKTKVGKNVFIGANTNLIAPVSIGDNVFIAAGSTVTKDLPDNSFCIARSREVIKPDYQKDKEPL